MLAPVAAALALAAVVAAHWLYINVWLVVVRLIATRNVPEPPGSLLLGHIPQLVAAPGKSFEFFNRHSRQLGPIWRVRFFHRPVLVVTDPDLFSPLLRNGPRRLPKYQAPYRMFELFLRPPRSNILSASCESPVYKAVRRAAVESLTMNKLRLCFPAIAAVTHRLIAGLEAAGPQATQDMDLAAACVTVDVIGLAGFGTDLHATGTTPIAGSNASAGSSVKGTEVVEVVKRLTIAMQSRNNPLNRWLPWRPQYKELRAAGARMTELVEALMADMEAHPPPPHSLGAALLACKDANGVPLDKLQIGAEVGLFWGAGFETTAHTICWTLFLVATHPLVEQRLTAELAGLGLLATPEQPVPQPLQWEHLAQLKYLAAVLNESMRMFPVVSTGTIRITDKPMNLAGHNLPAGQPVLFPFFAIHRSPRLWVDPDSFKPERWLDEATAPPIAGSGPAAAAPAGDAGAAAGGSESSASTDWVDVADDMGGLRDQMMAADQQLLQQGGRSKPAPGLRQRGTGPAAAASGEAGAAAGPAGAAAGSSGLELKDPTLGRRGFLPFSEGSRNCVGQALALVELKAVLALLLGHMQFSLAPGMGGYEGVAADAFQALTLRPKRGLLMTARHRGRSATLMDVAQP